MCSSDSRADRSPLIVSSPTLLTPDEVEWKQTVASSFGKAVDSYDQYATVQHRVATALAETIVGAIQSAHSGSIESALEIGCGTGFLTRKMLTAFPETDWSISDVSPQMIEHCRRHPEMPSQRESRLQFLTLDGESIHDANFVVPQFDMICSSLAFQWFVNLPNALNQLMDLVCPAGWLFFSTLGHRNYSRVMDEYPELRPRVNQHSNASTIQQTLDARTDTDTRLISMKCDVRYDSLRDFVRSVTAIGAGVPSLASRRSSFGLRNAIRRSQDSGKPVVADYHVLLVAVKKKS